jgi:hypothetical protein
MSARGMMVGNQWSYDFRASTTIVSNRFMLSPIRNECVSIIDTVVTELQKKLSVTCGAIEPRMPYKIVTAEIAFTSPNMPSIAARARSRILSTEAAKFC